MEKSLAQQLLDGEITPLEHALAVISDGTELAEQDLAGRTPSRIVIELGGSAGETVTVKQVEE